MCVCMCVITLLGVPFDVDDLEVGTKLCVCVCMCVITLLGVPFDVDDLEVGTKLCVCVCMCVITLLGVPLGTAVLICIGAKREEESSEVLFPFHQFNCWE